MDKLLTNTPINKTAAMVTGRGESYTPKKIVKTADSSMPIAINRYKKCEIIGLRRGRLTVLGASADKNGRVVVRCDCGTYTLRTAKAMKNVANDQDRCEHCRHLAHLKRNEVFRRTGKDINPRDL